MNLEHLEELCTKYLEQTANPLVPLDTLFQYLQRDATCADISRNELLAFLNKHEMFHIIETMPQTDSGTAEQLNDIGIQPGPRVILRTRIPTPAELTGLIERQLNAMSDALNKAYEEAEQEGNEEAVERTREMLDRLEHLHEAFKKIL